MADLNLEDAHRARCWLPSLSRLAERMCWVVWPRAAWDNKHVGGSRLETELVSVRVGLFAEATPETQAILENRLKPLLEDDTASAVRGAVVGTFKLRSEIGKDSGAIVVDCAYHAKMESAEGERPSLDAIEEVLTSLEDVAPVSARFVEVSLKIDESVFPRIGINAAVLGGTELPLSEISFSGRIVDEGVNEVRFERDEEGTWVYLEYAVYSNTGAFDPWTQEEARGLSKLEEIKYVGG